MSPGRPLRRTRKGDFVLDLPEQEREVLRTLPGQLRTLLRSEGADDDDALGRLFPPAYTDDDESEAEYRRLMRAELLERHEQALQVMEETVGANRLSEEEVVGWLQALNQLRLVLGTQLDVTEDLDYQAIEDDDPRRQTFAVYGYLSWLQESIVEVLAR